VHTCDFCAFEHYAYSARLRFTHLFILGSQNFRLKTKLTKQSEKSGTRDLSLCPGGNVLDMRHKARILKHNYIKQFAN